MLPHLSAYEWSIARDISGAGVVAGTSLSRDGFERAVIWDDGGEIHDLGVLSDAQSNGNLATYARPINDMGEVVGHTFGNWDAWKWDPANGMVKLQDYGYKGVVYDVNNNGWSVGWADIRPYETVPVVWDPEGGIHNLQVIVQSAEIILLGELDFPVSINDMNEVAVYGYVATAGGDGKVMIVRISGALVSDARVRFEGRQSTGCPAAYYSDALGKMNPQTNGFRAIDPGE